MWTCWSLRAGGAGGSGGARRTGGTRLACWALRAGWAGGSDGARLAYWSLRAGRSRGSSGARCTCWARRPDVALRALRTRGACGPCVAFCTCGALRTIWAWRTCWPLWAGVALRAWRTRWSLGYSLVLVLVLVAGVCRPSPRACQYQEKKGRGHCKSRTSLISHTPLPVRYDSAADLIYPGFTIWNHCSPRDSRKGGIRDDIS